MSHAKPSIATACPANGRSSRAATQSRVLLYFHGGGYCSGSIVSHRRLVTEAGRAARTRTLAIDYRRAPEHPYPAAHEDALTAWRFLRRQGIAAKTSRSAATAPAAISRSG